jgi:putative hemolysin
VAEAEVTESEILALIEQGTLHGALLTQEQRMMEGVLNLADRRIDSLMVPRIEIERLDIQNSLEENRRIYLNTLYNHLPVEKGSIDQIIGVVSVQELLKQEVAGVEVDIEKAIKEPIFVPENVSALKVLNQMRENNVNLAIVIDEFSGTQGMVTVIDILEGIVGDLPTAGFPESPEIVLRPDGTYLIDGLLPIEEFRELFSLEALPDEDRGSFQTVGGFVMSCLGRIPAVGDSVEWEEIRIEVVDMDGFRIDKVIIHPPEDKVD